MAAVIVSASFVLIICVVAYLANRRFRSEDRLPMQWGFTGAVNWSAPRHLALSFMPIVAVAVLGFQAFMATNVPARPGQEDLVFPVLVGSGAMLIMVQLLHVWLIGETIRRSAR